MKNYIFLLVALITLGHAVAENKNLQAADRAYSLGEYEQAVQMYEKVIANDGVAPELYYNLGNAYFKTKETAKAILNYERALRLNPRMEDATYNLQLAQLRVVDKVSDGGSFFLFQWVGDMLKFFTSNQWLWVGFISFLIFLVALFIFVFGNSVALRKVFFYIGVVFFSMSLLTLVSSGVRKQQMLSHNEAIIMSDVVTAKSSPDKSGTDLFQLHEGTKVEVKSVIGSWIEILLSNGNVGWLEQKHLERI